MMDTLSIPEVSPLSSGDLLLHSFESAIIGLDGPVVQDGLKSSLSSLDYSAETVGHGISMDLQSTGMDQDSFSTGWFDTKTDLLQYLTGVEYEPADNVEMEITSAEEVKPPVEVHAIPITPQDPTETAVTLLKSLVEDTCQQLSNEEPVEVPLPLVPEVTMEDLDLKEEDLQLLDLLTQSMEDTSDVMLDSTVLSPITSDDVDSILSSGPCSPASESSSYVADCSQSSVGDGTVGGVDMSLDLAKLLTQVQNPAVSSTVSFDPISSDTVSVTVSNYPLSPSDNEPDTSLSDPDYMPEDSPDFSVREKSKLKSKRGVKRLDPETKLLERKMRKKQQNKDAATRYRQKKRAESGEIGDQVSILEKRNKELHESVDQMAKEISYIKNLLAEVYKSRGLIGDH